MRFVENSGEAPEGTISHLPEIVVPVCWQSSGAVGRASSMGLTLGAAFLASRFDLLLAARIFTWRPDVVRWKQLFASYGPLAAYRELTDGLPEPNAVRIAIGPYRTFTYHLVINKARSPAAYARRVVHPDEGYAHHDLLMISPKHQRQGIGGRVLRNAARFYDSLGVQSIRNCRGARRRQRHPGRGLDSSPRTRTNGRASANKFARSWNQATMTG